MESNITKQTIAAIKHCSYLGFRLQGCETKLEAVKRARDQNLDTNPFVQDAFHYAEVQTKVSDYSKGTFESFPVKNYKGWASEDNYDFSPNSIQLLSNLLKEGDCLIAHWVVDNGSDWTKKNALHRDQLKLEIHRFDKRKEDWKIVGGLNFVDSMTGEDNSLIRMIRSVS